MLQDVTARRLWVVRGGVGGQTVSIVVEAATQWEAAYLGASKGLRIVVLGETVPYDGRGGDATDAMFCSTAPLRQNSAALPENRAFGLSVTAAQRAVFIAAGVAVAVLNWQLSGVPQ